MSLDELVSLGEIENYLILTREKNLCICKK